MTAFLENFHFLRPLWLIALVVPIFFYMKYYKGIKNKSSWENVCDKKLLKFLLIKGSSQDRKLLGCIALAAYIITIISISGPAWSKKEAPNLTPENPVMIVLNLSSDMNAADLKPSRAIRARYKISDLLMQIYSVQAGIIVYTNEPFQITPITEDKNIVVNLLQSIDTDIMPDNGDRLDRAINMAVDKFKSSRYIKGNIIVFTSDVGQKFDLAISSAAKAYKQGFPVSVVNVSLENNDKLELIAKSGGGIFTVITPDDKDIKLISDRINSEFKNNLKKSENISLVWEEYGYYLSILSLILCLYFFRKGILVILFVLSISNPAHANFFLNHNQQGLRQFKKENFVKAANKFKDHQWKGAALYKAGDYENAYKEFAKGKNITSIYNQGNALAKSGKIDEAIKKYEEVLEKDPKHEDAKFNLEYLKQQQQNQQQNQDSNFNDEKNEENNDNTQGSQGNNSQDEQNEEQQNQQNQEDVQSGEDKNQEQKQDNSGGQKSEQEDKKDSEQKSQEQKSSSVNNQKNADEDKELLAATQTKEGEKDLDEEVQAREQQYREIPEDIGGLLRAFIKKEYNKNRYKDK